MNEKPYYWVYDPTSATWVEFYLPNESGNFEARCLCPTCTRAFENGVGTNFQKVFGS